MTSSTRSVGSPQRGGHLVQHQDIGSMPGQGEMMTRSAREGSCRRAATGRATAGQSSATHVTERSTGVSVNRRLARMSSRDECRLL